MSHSAAAASAAPAGPPPTRRGVRRLSLTQWIIVSMVVLMAIVLALCVWWNIALIVEFGTGLMNRQRLEPRRNAPD